MQFVINSPKYGLHIVYIDDNDYDLVKKYTWRLNRKGNNVYAVTTIIKNKVKKTIKLHRLIMGFPKLNIDHVDGNGLNNNKNNLRIATHLQNQKNKRSYKNTSGFNGVCFSKKTGKYQSQIKVNGVLIWGGYYDNTIDAAKKYNELAIIYNGEFANLNIIPND